MADASFQNPIEDIIECPICTETLKNTRVLPCIHTFCLRCIAKCGKDKKPGETMQCPCCRNEFHVPMGGLAKLPKNTFLEKLLEVQSVLTTEWANSCRICTMPGHRKNSKNQSLAIFHCVECKQHMCGGCRSVHLRQGGTSSHHVLPVQKENHCQGHPDKQLDRFCKTCKTPVCGKCCESNHKSHDWSTFVNYAGTLEMEIEKLRLHNTQLSSQLNRRDRELPLSLDAIHNDIQGPRYLRVIVLQQPTDVDHNRFMSQSHEGQNIVHILAVVVILLLAFGWQSRAWMNEERASWSSEKYNYTLSEESLKGQIHNLTDKVQYAYHPALTNTFQHEPAEGRAAVALTFIDDKLLIANSKGGDLKVLDAYSLSNESDWTTMPFYSVAGMGLCPKNGQVFVSTWNKYIFRFNRNGEILGQWRVEAVASGVISVTNDCNIILAVRDNSKKIITYSTNGEIISDVEMKADILESRLMKAVKISKGHFLVSYGEGEDPMHGIDIVNVNGHTLKTYGRKNGADVGQLSDPRDFVVDRMGNVLVADSGNGRILLLDSELNFQRELVSMEHGLQHPFGILLKEFDSQLYVADNQWDAMKKEWTGGRITVFKIK